MWRKQNPNALLVGIQTGATALENSIEFPQKIKNGTALWPNNSTSGNISKETQNTNSKEYVHPYVHCSVIYNCQDLEAAQVPISRSVNKKSAVHLQMEYYAAVKKNRRQSYHFQ